FHDRLGHRADLCRLSQPESGFCAECGFCIARPYERRVAGRTYPCGILETRTSYFGNQWDARITFRFVTNPKPSARRVDGAALEDTAGNRDLLALVHSDRTDRHHERGLARECRPTGQTGRSRQIVGGDVRRLSMDLKDRVFLARLLNTNHRA